MYREAEAGKCLWVLYRNSRILTFWQTQKLVDAYGGDRWKKGPEHLEYYCKEAVKILNLADDKRKGLSLIHI